MSDSVRAKLAKLQPTTIAVAFCTMTSALVLAALVLATVAHDFHLLRTSTISTPYPMTIYGLMPAPGTSPVRGAPGASGADFSQVYTSALALRHGESAYRPTTPEFADRFHRPPGYPPLMNLLYVPLSFLSYYHAFLFHVIGSVVALLGASFLLLRKLALAQHFKWIALCTTTLYFLTPIGLTHLERGQFDLVTATSYVLVFGCLYLPGARFGWALASGIVGALKWTAVAFLGCYSALGFLIDSGIRRWHFALVPVVMLLSTVVFWPSLQEYWVTIQVYEIDAEPFGLTLQHFLPRTPAKLVPVLLTLVVAGLVLLRARSSEQRRQLFVALSAPFTLALMGLAVCFGTLSYEYHTVAMLGAIPAVVIWVERDESVSKALKVATCATFALFLFVTFRVFPLGELLDPAGMAVVYVCFVLLCSAECVYIALSPARGGTAPEPSPS